jgi:hypothetical protein
LNKAKAESRKFTVSIWGIDKLLNCLIKAMAKSEAFDVSGLGLIRKSDENKNN